MFSTDKLCATTLYGDKNIMEYMLHAKELSLGDKAEELNKSNKNARSVLIKQQKRILSISNNLLNMLSKADRNKLVDDCKDEVCKIISSCETFLDILEET